ncbi:MAG TPA: hypothetical protein VE818_07450, partial [Nitrososphaeraceae archaeon]|nr:hypothetical protein [Nitrososphaeraceae archaeon]
MTTNAASTITTKGKIRTRGIGRGGSEEEDIERFGVELSQKIVNATEGFTDHFVRLLKKQLLESNIEAICDYILAIKAERNLSV